MVFQSQTDLQFLAEVLRVGNKAAVGVPFVEPGAAANLCRLLLPKDGGPDAIVQLHVESPSIRSHDHILWVWLNWKRENETNTQKFSPVHIPGSLCCVLQVRAPFSGVGGRTWVIGLLQLEGVDDAEREPDTLWFHLFAVEPVWVNGLVNIVVGQHHGTSGNERSSAGRRRRRLDLCGRRLKRDGNKEAWF